MFEELVIQKGTLEIIQSSLRRWSSLLTLCWRVLRIFCPESAWWEMIAFWMDEGALTKKLLVKRPRITAACCDRALKGQNAGISRSTYMFYESMGNVPWLDGKPTRSACARVWHCVVIGEVCCKVYPLRKLCSYLKHRQITNLDVTDLGFSGPRIPVCATGALSGCDPDCPVQTPNRASGPKWKKNGRKIDFGRNGKKGKKWPKNGKIAIFDPFLGQFSHFSAIFSPFSRFGQNPFFCHFFPFRAGGPIWGLYRAIRIATVGTRHAFLSITFLST